MHMSKHRCPQRLEEALDTLQLVCGSCESPELGARILIQGLSKEVLITADPPFQYLWFKREKKKYSVSILGNTYLMYHVFFRQKGTNICSSIL